MYAKYGLLARMFARVTGQEWITQRSARAEFGLPPGALYERELSQVSTADLLRYDRDVLLAAARRQRAAATARDRAVA